MAGITNKHIAELLNQMRFTTESQKAKQLDAAQGLLKIIDAGREYPLEFVCYHITGFRPKGQWAEDTIRGDQLKSDLQIFIARLGAMVCELAAQAGQKVYDIKELAEKLGVADKTINRWRKKGLVARKFIFEDGRKKLGFTQSEWERFEKDNRQLVERAELFTQLSKKQKDEVIAAARSLATNEKLNRRAVIDRIAEQFGRARETIRYTLADHEQMAGAKIFRNAQTKLNASESSAVYKSFAAGASVGELMKKFAKSKSAIYRIINQRRIRELSGQKIEFMASEEFDKQDVGEDVVERVDNYSEARPSASLTRQREIELFRRYNYLKYLADIEIKKLKGQAPRSSTIKKIENLLTAAGRIQKFLIEINQGLVVSIASKHISAAQNVASMGDMVNEGNLSLMRAVEKFDYTRGYRFSTYATWAIAKDFARKMPVEAARLDKGGGADLENVQKDLRISDQNTTMPDTAKRSLEQIMRENLDEREQYIIRQHFGFSNSVIRRKGASLKQIGEKLDLSKERVRQIELEALAKLRHVLSQEEFEMLTG